VVGSPPVMVVVVVGVTDRCGNRVVGTRSSIRLEGMDCDLWDAISGSLV
jgi:hypothetical protein